MHCLLRVSQEAITNAVDHAQAQEISVELSFDENQMHLRVCDNGRGFDPQVCGAERFGLIGMRERAEKIGGGLLLSAVWAKEQTVTVFSPPQAPLL